MNAHESNRIFFGDGRHFGLVFGSLLRFDKAEETKQALALELIKSLRQAEQALHIGMRLFAARLGQQPGRIMGFGELGLEALRQ